MLPFFLLVLGAVSVVSTAASAPLPGCVIDFERGCPDAGPQCGAVFSGGQGCFESAPLQQPLCSQNDRGYKLQGNTSIDPDRLTIEFAGDVWSLRMLFNSFTSVASLAFFDADGEAVGEPVQSLHCRSSSPDPRTFEFERPVRRIEVTASGSAWIDELHVNPSGGVSTGVRSWSSVKARF